MEDDKFPAKAYDVVFSYNEVIYELKHTQMKYLLFFACFLISCVSLYGQQAVKVEYDYHFFTVKGYETNRPMILSTSTSRSKFYNPDTNRIDSAYNSPEKKAAFDAYVNSTVWSKDDPYPARWEKMYVEKDRNKNIMTVYTLITGSYCYRFSYFLIPVFVEFLLPPNTKHTAKRNIIDSIWKIKENNQ